MTLKQNFVILNFKGASYVTINIATHIDKVKRLGLRNISRELFNLLLENRIIIGDIAMQMKGMVGFRNIAVYAYQNLNLEIVIVEKYLVYFEGL